MNKKVIIIIGSILSIFIIIVIVIPQIFKDEIKDEILRNINRNTDLEISIDDYDLSLISNFPRLTFYFEGVKVFDAEKKELISINEIAAEIDTKDLILNSSISLNKISIIKPIINYALTNDSIATTQDGINKTKLEKIDITKSSESITEEALEDKSTITLNISNYEIIGAYISIKDENDNKFVEIVNLNHNGFGAFQNDILTLNTHTSIDSISVYESGSSLLKNAQIKGDLTLGLDFKNQIYSLKENSLSINKIELNWVGVIKEIGDDINIDLRFDTPNTNFKDLLVMIPEDYKKDFENIETKGVFNIEGNILGIYNDETMPEFNLKSSITNAYIKYPDLPESIDDINLILNINKPKGNDFDKLSIDIPSASVKIANNKIEASMSAYNLVTDPHLKAKISANIDLSKLRNAIPIEKDDNINGEIFADIFIKGKMSDLENERYNKFDAKGDIRLTNFSFSTKSLKNKILISKANIAISPKNLQLKTFDFKIGKSDIKAKGTVSKYLEYMLEDKQLLGTLNIKSNYFYASDFMPLDEETVTDNESTTSTESETDKEFAMDVIEIPANISFQNNIDINHFIYGSIEADKLKGKLGMQNENAYLKDIRMKTLDGVVLMNGNYSSKSKKAPKADFDLNFKNIDIQKFAKTFDFVKEIAPIIKNTTGRISSKLDFKTTLDATMNPVYETMYSKGTIKTSNVSLKNTDFIKNFGNILNVDEFKKDPKIDDLNISYTIKKGILTMSPFKLNIADIKSELKGSSNIGKQTLDMDVSIIFPRKYLGKETNNIIDNAVSLANTFGMDVKVGKTIDVDAKIKGDVKSPKYSLSYGPGKAETPEEYLKQQADKIIKDAKKDAGKDLEKKANDLLRGLFK